MKKVKKILTFCFLFIIFPIVPLAYSDYIIPGGESVGIEISTDGIMVVGFYKVNGKFNKGTPSIKIGDRIAKVNGKKIYTVNELVEEMESHVDDGGAKLTVLRDKQEKEIVLDLIKEDETYKTGLYVKDEISGIGTLTYIDPNTKIYGALGHNIVESNTQKLVEVRTGNIFESSITSIDRSTRGTPGGKNAKFYSNNKYGTIEKNTLAGIYGDYTSVLPIKEALRVAKIDEIEEGKAQIVTVLEGKKLGYYDIEITKVDKFNETKNIYFEVKDKELLEKTGGIVQGMSGSPIIQNNKIIGAVTHVIISNPANGYGISIIKMLEEGER